MLLLLVAVGGVASAATNLPPYIFPIHVLLPPLLLMPLVLCRSCVTTTKALHFLHSYNIVHRDIKSLNVLLDAGGTAKLSDFGLAQISSTVNKDTGGTYHSKVVHVDQSRPQWFSRVNSHTPEMPSTVCSWLISSNQAIQGRRCSGGAQDMLAGIVDSVWPKRSTLCLAVTGVSDSSRGLPASRPQVSWVLGRSAQISSQDFVGSM